MSLVLTTLAFSLGFIGFWKCQVALAYSRFLPWLWYEKITFSKMWSQLRGTDEKEDVDYL